MSTFYDNKGRQWTVVITGKQLCRARSHGKINLSDLFAGMQASADGKVAVDPVLLLELCYYGCADNARVLAGKVDKDDFLEALTGKALTDALQATAEAMQECFAPPKKAGAAEEEPHPLDSLAPKTC